MNPSSLLPRQTLPYFDYLLKLLNEDNQAVTQSFGRHVHWGYWEQPKTADLSVIDFQRATEQLTAELCLAGKVNNGLTVLDVGCGFGGTIAFINEHYQDMQCHGVNLDRRQLQRAQALVSAKNNNVIAWHHANACALPFANQSVDVVLAVECIFHFPSREQFFREVQRVLKPNGYLALSDFLPSRWLLPLMQFNYFGQFYGTCHLNYRPADYQRLGQETGLQLLLERDITVNTLPTYRYLHQLARQQGLQNRSAQIETAFAALFSYSRLLQYYLYAWQKADCHKA